MLFYEQVEQLHDSVEGWKIKEKIPEQQTAGIAQEKTQTKEASNLIEALPVEDHNERDAAGANAGPTVAEARLPPKHDNESARLEQRMVEQSATPPGTFEQTRPADADSYISPSADATSDSTAAQPTNRTDSAHVNLPNNTHFLNVHASTAPSINSANRVIPTSGTTLPPPPPVEAMKGNRQITPAMRTAPPRKSQGSMSKGGQRIGKVSSMVTAN